MKWFSGERKGNQSSLVEYRGGTYYGKLTANETGGGGKEGGEIMRILQSLTGGIVFNLT